MEAPDLACHARVLFRVGNVAVSAAPTIRRFIIPKKRASMPPVPDLRRPAQPAPSLSTKDRLTGKRAEVVDCN